MHWREKQLLDVMQDEKMTTRELVNKVDMSKVTALKYLDRLKEKNLVDFEEVGNAKIWFLKEEDETIDKRTKVLVVDDDKNIINIIHDFLEPDQFEVLAASNGKEALGMVFIESPDILILDIMMPEMDGLKVCKELKKNAITRNLPIIVLSAKTSLDDKLKAMDLGINDYIGKPFDLRELRARINMALRSGHDI
ncbi:MAG: response regulator [Methanosarcinaceae archaeon]|nr:response regulator [Methanosarcinaceae archaeon]